MLKTETETLIRQLRSGQLDPAQTLALEKTPAKELLDELLSVYKRRFQERRLRNKWELGTARSFSLEPRSLSGKGPFPILLFIPVFKNCLFVSGEGDVVTGIAFLNRLDIRPVGKPEPGLALTMGKGYQLDKMPDGWRIKPMAKRTTRLASAFLQKRGWRFDALAPFMPEINKAE